MSIGSRDRYLRLAGFGIALPLIAACRRADAPTDGDAPTAAVTAGTAEVRAQPFAETIDAVGSVVARPGRIVSLSAPSPTRVSRIHVSVGEFVSAGQPLIEFEQAMFLAAVEGAAASLAAAEHAYERAQRLAEQGIVPRKDVEQAATDLARARAEVVAARRDAQLSILRSPIAGVVTRMDAALGASVDANVRVIEVADPSAFDVVVPVTSSDASRIRRGARATLAAGEAMHRDTIGGGSVADVAPGVDSTTRSVAVRIETTGTRRRLRLGETIFAQIVVAVHPNALVVPLDALVPDGDGFHVFVVDSAGIAHSRPVSVAGRTGAVAEITDGLALGERVVTTGAYGVDDGVKIVEAAASPPP
jgi:RND family efflux transporter MFP subunit